MTHRFHPSFGLCLRVMAATMLAPLLGVVGYMLTDTIGKPGDVKLVELLVILVIWPVLAVLVAASLLYLFRVIRPVTITEEGIIHPTGRGAGRLVRWDAMRWVQERQRLPERYITLAKFSTVVIDWNADDRELYLPLWVIEDKPGFLRTVRTYAGPENPLVRYLEEDSRKNSPGPCADVHRIP